LLVKPALRDTSPHNRLKANVTEQRAEDNKEEGWPREETKERGLVRWTLADWLWQSANDGFLVLSRLVHHLIEASLCCV